MRRHALLAAAGVALFGRPVLGVAPSLPAPAETPTPLPARLTAADVTALRAMTRHLDRVAKAYGGSHHILTPVASRAERLLSVPGSEAIKKQLAVAIAELHIAAGWAAFDGGHDNAASYHLVRAMELGSAGDDGFVLGRAAYLAGVATAERGHHNDGLKLLQLGRISLDSLPPTAHTRELASWLAVDSADLLARMNHLRAARGALALARDTWRAPNADDQADMAWVTALVELTFGRLEMAERLVSTAVRHWEGTADRRQAVLGDITLAAIHVRAGESSGYELAHRAITAVAELRSARARDRLVPLVAGLESRRGVAAWRLAGFARQVMDGAA